MFLSMKKFFMFLLFVLTVQIASAQTVRVSIHEEGVKLKTVLVQMEKQTGYSFYYNNADIDDSVVVSVKAENQSVEQVLSSLIPGVKCIFSGKKIILSKKPEPEVILETPKSTRLHGSLKDTDGEPLIGASAIVKHAGKTYGAVADLDGNFVLELPFEVSESDVINFSCIGYEEKSEVIGKRSQFDVKMELSSMLLSETVVVGYGTQKKANLTGAVASVSSKELENRPVANVGQALQGMIPNLNVNMPSGQPGAEASFNIRGNTSPNGGSPLILVDGVETNLSRINPNDIESISVLKDASSAAIYGARGAFGVILVTTKSGAGESAPQVSADLRFSFSDNTASTDFETRGYYSAYISDFFLKSRQGVPYTSYTDYDYQRLWERRNDVTENPERPWVLTEMRDGQMSYVYLANFDWYNWMFNETRPTQDYNINVSGGSKHVKYMVSGRYYHQDGMFRIGKDDYDSFNVRAKLDIQIKPWLRLSSNTRVFASDYFYNGNEYRKPTMHALASLVPVNPDGTAVSHTMITNSSSHYIMDGYSAMLVKGKQWGDRSRKELTQSFALTADICKGLKFVADYSYLFAFNRTTYRDATVEYSMFPGIIAQESTSSYKDRYDDEYTIRGTHVANAYFSYDNTWKNAHHFTATAGVNFEMYKEQKVAIRRDDLLSEKLSDFSLATGNIDKLTGGVNEYALMGAFFRLTYGYKGRYLLETNGRYDGSSRFLKGHKWGFFPSVSAAWRMTEEPWMQSSKKILNNLKLRLSYGALGNQSIDNYAYYQTVNTSGTMNYTFNGSSLAGHAVVSAPVSSGTWETVVSENIGLDLGFLMDKLTFSGDFYIRKTKGILTTGQKLPSIYGASEPLVNANDLRTTGWELMLTWKDGFDVGSHRFNYQIGASLSDYTAVYTRCDNPSGILSDPYVGKRLGEIWGFRVDGLFATDQEAAEYASRVNLQYPYKDDFNSIGEYGKGVRAGDLKYLDLNNDGKVDQGSNTLKDPGDRVVIGNSQPRFSYGFNVAADFYGFDFQIFFQGIGHMDWYPGSDNMRFWGPYCRPYASFIGRDFMKDVWSENNPDAYFPRARAYTSLNGQTYYTNDRYLQNLAYIRLKNLTLGYTLPEKALSAMHMKDLRIYFSGENLWYWSPLHSKYVDPEFLTMDSDKNGKSYAMYKTFSFGITLKF